MNRKKTIIILGCTLILLVSASFVIYESYYKTIWSHRDSRVKRHELIEKSYQKNPNLNDAFDLMDYYIGKEDFEKALYYSKACLRLGANDELLDGKINFFLARIYYAQNKKNLAKTHLLTAIEFSKRNTSEKIELIRKYGLSDIAPPGFRGEH